LDPQKSDVFDGSWFPPGVVLVRRFRGRLVGGTFRIERVLPLL
jgi:hypothetical protein